jgi:hypothetical protein
MAYVNWPFTQTSSITLVFICIHFFQRIEHVMQHISSVIMLTVFRVDGAAMTTKIVATAPMKGIVVSLINYDTNGQNVIL